MTKTDGNPRGNLEQPYRKPTATILNTYRKHKRNLGEPYRNTDGNPRGNIEQPNTKHTATIYRTPIGNIEET